MKNIKFYALSTLAIGIGLLGGALVVVGGALYDLGDQVAKVACEMGEEMPK